MASYSQVYNFVQQQVLVLTAEYEVPLDQIVEQFLKDNEDVDPQKAEKIVRRLVQKVNGIIAKRNRQLYTRQGMDQVTSQMLNNEKALKLDAMDQIKHSLEFMVPRGWSDTNLEGILNGVKQLPDIKHLSFQQLQNNTKSLEEEDGDDDLMVVGEPELKKKLGQYLKLRTELNVQRLRVLQAQQKLNYYRNIRRKLEAVGDLVGVEEELKRLKENITRVGPKLKQYNEDAVIDENGRVMTFQVEQDEERINQFYEKVGMVMR